MPPKPVDQRRPEETRDAIWQAVRETRGRNGEPNRPFTPAEIRGETRCTKEMVREYLVGLVAGGFVAKTNDGTYVLVRDTGIEPPRVRRDGTLITMGTGRENMWRTIPILQEFTPRELAIAASTEQHQVTEVDADCYTRFLYRAGYLAQLAAAKRARRGPGTPALYLYLPSKYSGPKPPQIQRVKQVYDPNLRRVVWTGAADE